MVHQRLQGSSHEKWRKVVFYGLRRIQLSVSFHGNLQVLIMVLPEADNALGLPDILGLDGKGMVAAQVNLNRRTLKRQSLQFNCPGSSFETALSYYYFEVSSFLQKCSVFRYLSNVSQFSGFVTRFLFSTCVPLISPTQNWINWTHARETNVYIYRMVSLSLLSSLVLLTLYLEVGNN